MQINKKNSSNEQNNSSNEQNNSSNEQKIVQINIILFKIQINS